MFLLLSLLLFVCKTCATVAGRDDVGDCGQAPAVDMSQLDYEDDIKISQFDSNLAEQKLFMNDSKIGFFVKHKGQSPLQHLRGDGIFNLSGDVWKNYTSMDQSSLLNAFRSVVNVQSVYEARNSIQTFTGSAFFITPTKLLTAGHNAIKCKCQTSDGEMKKCSKGFCPTGQTRYKLRSIYLCQEESTCFTRYASKYRATIIDESKTGQYFGWTGMDDVCLLQVEGYKSMAYVKVSSLSKFKSKPTEVIVIGYPYVGNVGAYDPVAIKNGVIHGSAVVDFFTSMPGEFKKAIAIGNITQSSIKETWFNDAPTWGGVSGGLVLVITKDQCFAVGVHVGGSVIHYSGNAFHTSDHPFIAQYVDYLPNKDEL